MAQGSPEIVAALLEDLSEEVRAAIQYVWLHVAAKGMVSPVIAAEFISAARVEMSHAEKLAERIDYYGVQLPSGPWSVKSYAGLQEMLQASLAVEQQTIKRYKAHIGLADRLQDPAVRLILEEILKDEEGHAYSWETLLSV